MYAESGFQPSPSTAGPASFSSNAQDEDNEELDPSFLSMFEDEEEDGGVEAASPDLYAVLGVARDASEAEIRVAYRRLSRLLHPDKHTESRDDAKRHADAEAAFGRITAAYKILTNAQQRAIYNQYGFRGLRLHGWEVAVRDKSAPEMRLEYLLLKRKAREEEQSYLLQPNSEFSVGFDMTDFFDRYLKEPPQERIYSPAISIYEVAISQSIVALRLPRQTVSLAGQVTTHNGLGTGALLAIWQRHLPPSTPYLGTAVLETVASYGRGGRGPGFEVKLQKQMRDRVNLFTSLGGVLTWSPHNDYLVYLPSASLGCEYQITPHIRSTLQYQLQAGGGISCDLLWVSEDGERNCRFKCRLSIRNQLHASLRFDTAVGWAWMNPFRASGYTSFSRGRSTNPGEWDANLDEDEDDFMLQTQNKKGRISISLGCNPYDLIEARLGVNCVLSNISRLSGEIGASWLKGITLRISFHRGGQTYALPFKLSENLEAVAICYGTLIPLAIYGVIRNLVYAPWILAQTQRAQTIRRERLRDELRHLRSEALATQALMQISSAKIAAAEEATNGLVIVRAIYGSISDDNPSRSQLPDLGGPVSIDVTAPLQTSVVDHQLRIPPGRWSDLQGFYDPCTGLARTSKPLRRLFVAYLFNGLKHEVCVDETQGLAIPMSKHKVVTFS